MNYEKEEQAQKLIQAKQAEKESFLNYLGGKTIREVANVPQNITFINGLPRDNIENQEYGSYTVYLTHSGSCYHEKRDAVRRIYPPMHFRSKEGIARAQNAVPDYRLILAFRNGTYIILI